MRIVLALVLAVSLGMLFLHTHADEQGALCPQCVLLAGLVLPFLALATATPDNLFSPPRAADVHPPRSLLLWSRRHLRGPPLPR